MLLTAINEGAHLDDRAWDLINELNSLAARPFCVPTPLPVQASPGQVVTVRVEPNETVAEVRAKVEMATGVPQATAALAFTPPLLVGAAESEELEPVVLSSGDPLATDTGGVKLVDLGVDNGDLLQLGSLPPVGGVSAVVDLPTDLHGVFGEQLAVAANAHDTVESLKKKIDALVGIPLGDQCLRSAGSLDKLDDAQQLISHERRIRRRIRRRAPTWPDPNAAHPSRGRQPTFHSIHSQHCRTAAPQHFPHACRYSRSAQSESADHHRPRPRLPSPGDTGPGDGRS